MTRKDLTFGPRALLLGILTGALLLGVPLEAQRGPDGRRGSNQDRAQLEQRVRSQMDRMMRDRLDLTDDQADDLSALSQTFEGRRRELARSEQATRRRVEALMLEGGEDEEEARELLSRMSNLRDREAALFREEQDALLGILTPVQVLNMQNMRQQIGRRIRALRGGRGDDMGSPRRRGGGGAGRWGQGNVDGLGGVDLFL